MSLAEHQIQEGIHDQLQYLSHKAVKIPSRSQNRKPTATEILELIKHKRQQLTYGMKPSFDDKSEKSDKDIVLPRIKTGSKDEFSSLDVEPRSSSISYAKLQTEPNDLESSERSRHDRNGSKRHLTLECEEIDQQQELQEMKNTQMFRNCLSQVPRLTKFRNVKNMEALVGFLKQTNPFFKNMPEMLIRSLVKVCKIKNYERSEKIYHRSDKLTSLYIILWGKIRISDLISDFKKVSVRGETLCEHVLFDPSNPKQRFENAKALSDTSLLEIPTFLYKKIYEELVLYGYKNDFMAMENLFKRNFIFKQSLKTKQ